MALPLNTHTQNYVFGRGRLFFNRKTSGVSKGRHFMGNCPGFSLNVTSDVFEHESSTSGLSTTDLKITRRVTFGGSISIDDLTKKIWEYLFGGTASTLTQTNTPVTNEAIVVYKGGHFQLGLVGSNKVGIRDVTSVTVTNTAGSTTYTLDTDYALDAASGMIYIIDGGAITDGQTVHVDYTPTAGTRELITSGDAGQVEGELVYIADNASGDNRDLRLPLCTLSPSGDIAFITADNLAEATFEIGVSKLDSDHAQVYIAGRRVA